jgi:hypothetical protein
MTVSKHFAQDGTGLADHMDALLEVLASLLEEMQDPAATDPDNQGGAVGIGELRSDADRAIHVVVNNQEK